MPEHAATLETPANIARRTAGCLMPVAVSRPISVALNTEPEIEATKKMHHLVTGGVRSQRCKPTAETGLHTISSSICRENGPDLSNPSNWPICALHYSDGFN
jgi:hypothetical protein